MVPDNALVERFRADLDALINQGSASASPFPAGPTASPSSCSPPPSGRTNRSGDVDQAFVPEAARRPKRSRGSASASACRMPSSPSSGTFLHQCDPGAGACGPLRGAGAMGSGGAAGGPRYGASPRRPGRDAGDAPQPRFGRSRACGNAAAERRAGRQGSSLAAAASRLAPERAGARLHGWSGLADDGPEQCRRKARAGPGSPGVARCRMGRSSSAGEERCEPRGRG